MASSTFKPGTRVRISKKHPPGVFVGARGRILDTIRPNYGLGPWVRLDRAVEGNRDWIVETAYLEILDGLLDI